MKHVLKNLLGLVAVLMIFTVFQLGGKTLAVNAAAPITLIDSPSSGVNYYNKDVTVSGWAVNSSGISRVDVYVQGESSPRGSATISIPRPDVNAAVNQSGVYKDAANSGFSLSISKDSLTAGAKTFAVAAIGNDGSVRWATVRIDVNKPSPITLIDSPSSSINYYNKDINISGWAVNASGVNRVDIYIQGERSPRASVSSLYARPDVNAAVNGNGTYKNAINSGFSANIPANSLSAGNYTVAIAAIGNDGSVQWAFKSIYISKASSASSQMCLDMPSGNAVYRTDDISVAGWAVNASGINRVDVYVAGESQPRASFTSFLDRPDVNSIINSNGAYKNAIKSGFNAVLPLNSFQNGTYTIAVAAVGNDGSAQWSTRTIVVNKSTPQMNLDAPSGNQAYYNADITVAGWALNGSGIGHVDVYIQGESSPRASITSFYGRPDVNNAYNTDGKYRNGYNSGFNIVIPADSLKPGNYVISVAAIGNDGTVQWSNRSITLAKASPRINIDTPVSGGTYGGSLSIQGWGLNASSVNYFAIAIDGSTVSSVTSFTASADLVAAFPNDYYKNKDNSRFVTSISLSGLSVGSHTMTVTAVGKDGTIAVQSLTFNYRGPVTYTAFNTTLSNMLAVNLAQTPAAQFNNAWYYIKIQNGDKGYSNTVNGTFIKDPFIYDTIHSMLVTELNPANLVNDNVDCFQLMSLHYVGGVSAAGLNSFLSGTLTGKGQVFIDAGRLYDINPVYLAMHSREETGNGTSALSKGTVSGYEGYYNVFGINANDVDANHYGAGYAQSVGWTSVDLAIKGGAEWIAHKYINTPAYVSNSYYQNTLYEMQFNPFSPTSSNYCTDIDWAHNIAYYISQYYASYGSNQISFIVPQYNN